MNVRDHAVWKILRSSSWFVAANVLAGVFHYAFQVCASRELSAEEFAQLNAWYANLALFFFFCGLMQYAANFFPTPRRLLKPAIVAINLFCILLVTAWFAGPQGQTFLRALMVLGGATLFGWLLGQVQARLMFKAMTAANLLLGMAKIGLIALSTIGESPLERYSFALFACYLPALWWVSISLWWNREPLAELESSRPPFAWKLWAAPFILSVAGAIIPQMDLVLMDRIASALQYQAFARASLFYKGIYFLLFILAQWLLPQQIRQVNGRSNAGWLGYALAALVSSAGLALASPMIAAWILRWNEAPDMLLIFLSCLNMSLLTWIFLLIQRCCASHHVRVAAISLMLLGLESGVQLALHLEPNLYLLLAITIQAGIVFILGAVDV